MSGFLSLYSGTERVILGGDYWVEIRQFLSNADYATAQRALFIPKVKNQEVTATIESEAYQQTLVLLSIVNWNLTDENNVLMPVTIESVRRLPQRSFLQLLDRITELNNQGDLDVAPGATEREVAKAEVEFLAGAGTGSELKEDRPADIDSILGGAGLVGAVRSDQGNAGAPSEEGGREIPAHLEDGTAR